MRSSRCRRGSPTISRAGRDARAPRGGHLQPGHHPSARPARRRAAGSSLVRTKRVRSSSAIGRLTAQKNFALADRRVCDRRPRLRRAARHSRRRTGTGAARGESPRHGLATRVAMPGFVDNPYSYMARASVLALSSDFEGLPTVLIEGLALGTPSSRRTVPVGHAKSCGTGRSESSCRSAMSGLWRRRLHAR